MAFENSIINLEALKNKAFNSRWADSPNDIIPLTAADPDFPIAPEIINGITENSYNSIIITDQKGRNINPIIKNGNEIDLSNQKSGIYFLTIQIIIFLL